MPDNTRPDVEDPQKMAEARDVATNVEKKSAQEGVTLAELKARQDERIGAGGTKRLPNEITPQNTRLSDWFVESITTQDYKPQSIPGRNYYVSRDDTPAEMPVETYKKMAEYDKLNFFERFLANSLPTAIEKGKEGLEKVLPGEIEKGVYKAGEWIMKGLSVFDLAGEFVERGSGLVRQWNLARENDNLEDFNRQLGDAWAAGSMFYDTANAPIINDKKITFHTDLPSTGALPKLRQRVTELRKSGMGRKEALEQTRMEYMQDLGALSVRAAKQDFLGHVLFDPLMWLSLGGYAPVDIVKNTSQAARTSKYSVGYLDELADAAKIAENAGDLEKAADAVKTIGFIEDTHNPINAFDKAAMFLSGEFPEPAKGASKIDEILYFFGNELAQSESTAGKAWRKLNPFSLTPEARSNEWMTRIDDYLGTHVLAQGSPEVIRDTLVKLNSQARGDAISAIAVTPDGRMIQSFLASAELDAGQLLNDYRRLADDGALLMRVADKIEMKSPTLIDSIIDGKSDDIIRQLSSLDDEGAELASMLTDDVLNRFSNMKGLPYTEDLFTRSLHNSMLDEMAKLGVTKFGIKQRGLIQKWTAFMKAGETLAFLKANPTFAAKNWINNEMTMISRGVGGGFFTRKEDLGKLVDELNFTPLRASESFTMADMPSQGIEGLGEAASKTIREALVGDANVLDKWASKLNDVDLGWFDFGKRAAKVEASASRRAMVKGYTRAWRKFWKPGGFTKPSKALSRGAIRELGVENVALLDKVLENAKSLDDIDNILRNIGDIDLNKSTSRILTNAEKTIGRDLSTQFEQEDILRIQGAIGAALETGDPAEARKVFDDLYDTTINKILRESEASIDTRIAKAQQVAESERAMALMDVTEEITNHLDVANYLYAQGMSRFRPMDVSREVRDIYWPIWIDQQTKYWDSVYGKIDASIEGLRRGFSDMDVDIDDALKRVERQKGTWNSFFERRNQLYAESKKQGWENWDEVVEEVDVLYQAAAETGLSIQKEYDDLLVQVIARRDEDLAKGFAGFRQKIREWKARDRQLTRNYTYRQKTGELPPDAPTYADFWRARSRRYAELGELKNRGYAMLEGDQKELGFFADIEPSADTELEVLLNKPLASPEDIVYEYAPVSTPNNINEKTWYHGSKTAGLSAEDLDPNQTEVGNLFGPGIYLTDNPKIAHTYTRGTRPRGLTLPDRPVYKANVNINNAIDLTEELDNDLFTAIRQSFRDVFRPDIDDMASRQGITSEQFYSEVKDYLTRINLDGEMEYGEIIEFYQDVTRRLTDMGYDAFRHTGGERAGDELHNVIILLDPNSITSDTGKLTGVISEWNETTIDGLAQDLAGKATTVRAEQAMNSELGPMFQADMREEQWFSQNFFTLRELEEETIGAINSPSRTLGDMSDASRAEIKSWLNTAKREMSDAQYASLRMAEYHRDSALLNYNRKMNYDTWLGTFMPYEFWFTHSMMQWAVHSINRPAMLAFYQRVRKLQDRVSLDDDSFPTRLKGKMKIHVPGLPDWMGDDVYLDPLNILLPFGVMTMPYQMAKQHGLSIQGQVEREMNRMVADGDISRDQMMRAIEAQNGQIYNQALAKAQGERNTTDNYEILSALSSPHAPYDVAYKALSGRTEDIGPFLPATYTVNRLLGMFGVDAPHVKANPAARMRRWAGLPGFDKWEDYRVERMLANLSADGEITPDQASRAMIEHEGKAWELARKRAAKEFAGGPWWATLLKTVGAPTYIYPSGEFLQREHGDDFGRAMEAYEAGDYEAYNKFFDANPDFANRLALWDKPEERMKNFLVDELWGRYMDMTSLHKRQVRDALGPEFQRRFLDRDTRNYGAVTSEQMGLWLKMLGGDPPGTLGKNASQIQLAPDDVANQVQLFYDTRSMNFPDFGKKQDKYYMLKEGKPRREYLKQNPELKRYWDWRRDFLRRNPRIAPYIDDDFQPNYGSVGEMEEALASQPQFSLAELAGYIGEEKTRLAIQAAQGEPIPDDIRETLENDALSLGFTYQQLLQELSTSLTKPIQ